MAKITFLGTSAAVPTAKRDNTSFIFSYRDSSFLIDCPGSISQKLLKSGIDFRKLKNIIITHHHPDHIYGIISLVHSRAFIGNSAINIFSGKKSIKIINDILKIFSLKKKIYPKLNCIDILSRKSFYRKNGLTARAFKNIHTEDSFGILFHFANKKIFYSSDTAFYPELLNKLKNIDYLIHDCTASSLYFSKHPSLYNMHTSSLQIGRYLSDKKTKLIPVHFLLLDKNEEINIKRELKQLGKRLIFPQDFGAIKI